MQYEGSEAEFVTGLTAIQYVVKGKSIALEGVIASPDSAIKTIVYAIVSEFDESANVHVSAVVFPSALVCVAKEFRIELICFQE